jgi:hypothetical protein
LECVTFSAYQEVKDFFIKVEGLFLIDSCIAKDETLVKSERDGSRKSTLLSLGVHALRITPYLPVSGGFGLTGQEKER